jgi:hypothetical protein
MADRVLHLVPTPRCDAMRFLKAIFNVVEATNECSKCQRESTRWENPSQRLLRASSPGRPASGSKPGVETPGTPPPAGFIPPRLRRELRRKETQPSSATSERMGLWDLDNHDPQLVRVSYLHLPQPPRLVSRQLDNIHSTLLQLASYSVDVSHLQP